MGGPCSGQTRWVIGSGGEVVDDFWFGGVVFFRLLSLRLFVFDIHVVFCSQQIFVVFPSWFQIASRKCGAYFYRN